MIDLEDSVVEEKEIIDDKDLLGDEIGIKSINMSNYYRVLSSSDMERFKDFIVDYYDSGDGLSSFEIVSFSYSSNQGGYDVVFNMYGNIESSNIHLILPNPLSSWSGGEDVTLNSSQLSSYVKHFLFSPSDDCIGLNFLMAKYEYLVDENTISFEIVPKTIQNIDNPIVSGNGIDYTELLTSIDNRMERIEQNVESISNNIILICDGINDLPGDEVGSVTVSDNSIMDKYLSDYSVSEALLLFISISVFIAGIVVIIKKGVPRWH